MVVGRVNEVVIFLRHNVIHVNVAFGQLAFLGIVDEKSVFVVCLQIAPVFVTQIGGCFPVAEHFGAAHTADAPVIAGDKNSDILLRQLFEHGINRRMLEPRAGERTIGRLVRRNLFQDWQIRTAVCQNIHKIDHHAQQRRVHVRRQILFQIVAFFRGNNLQISRFSVQFQPQQPQMIVEQFLLVTVAAAVIIFSLRPHFRVAFFQIAGQQSAKNCVPRIRRSRRQNAVIVIFLDFVIIIKIWLER